MVKLYINLPADSLLPQQACQNKPTWEHVVKPYFGEYMYLVIFMLANGNKYGKIKQVGNSEKCLY